MYILNLTWQLILNFFFNLESVKIKDMHITLYADILHPVNYLYIEFSRGVETHFNYKLAKAQCF